MNCLPSFERCKSRLSCLLLTEYISLMKGTLSLKGRQTAEQILGINLTEDIGGIQKRTLF